MNATLKSALSLMLSAWALLAYTHCAHAQCTEFLPAWTHTASSCAVDESALTKYLFNLADFSFKGTEVSGVSYSLGVPLPLPIVARCNVLNPLDSGNPEWNTLIVGYQDPDGTTTAHSVRARLYRVNRPTGTASQVTVFDSNSSNVTSRTEKSVTFSHAFDFFRYEYFVQMELIRQNTSQNPVIYSARLTNVACVN